MASLWLAGNLRTSDADGPYDIKLLDVQSHEIRGATQGGPSAPFLWWCFAASHSAAHNNKQFLLPGLIAICVNSEQHVMAFIQKKGVYQHALISRSASI